MYFFKCFAIVSLAFFTGWLGIDGGIYVTVLEPPPVIEKLFVHTDDQSGLCSHELNRYIWHGVCKIQPVWVCFDYQERVIESCSSAIMYSLKVFVWTRLLTM